MSASEVTSPLTAKVDSKPKSPETEEQELTSSVEAAPEDPVPEPIEAPPKRSVTARIRDIEKRWGKSLEEVLIDIHDHVFGASDLHDESDEPLPPTKSESV